MQITWNAFKPRRKTFPEDENRTVNVWLAKQEQEGTACWPVDNQHLLLTAKAMKLSFPGSTMSWLDSGAIDLVEVKLQGQVIGALKQRTCAKPQTMKHNLASE